MIPYWGISASTTNPVFTMVCTVLGDFPSVYMETNEYERRDRTMTEFEQKQLEQLTRIADVLENINDTMNALGALWAMFQRRTVDM